MTMPDNIANRYVSAVEREQERERLYTRVLIKQLAEREARARLRDAEYAAKVALAQLEDFESEHYGDGDY